MADLILLVRMCASYMVGSDGVMDSTSHSCLYRLCGHANLKSALVAWTHWQWLLQGILSDQIMATLSLCTAVLTTDWKTCLIPLTWSVRQGTCTDCSSGSYSPPVEHRAAVTPCHRIWLWESLSSWDHVCIASVCLVNAGLLLLKLSVYWSGLAVLLNCASTWSEVSLSYYKQFLSF